MGICAMCATDIRENCCPPVKIGLFVGEKVVQTFYRHLGGVLWGGFCHAFNWYSLRNGKVSAMVFGKIKIVLDRLRN